MPTKSRIRLTPDGSGSYDRIKTQSAGTRSVISIDHKAATRRHRSFAAQLRLQLANSISSHPWARPYRILVVEEDARWRRIYTQTLSRYGHQVYTAEDGEAAWNALNMQEIPKKRYDLVITNGALPKLTGIELVQKLRAAQIHVAVILASGFVPENIDNLHFAAILQKPFPQEKLLEAVNAIMCVVIE